MPASSPVARLRACSRPGSSKATGQGWHLTAALARPLAAALATVGLAFLYGCGSSNGRRHRRHGAICRRQSSGTRRTRTHTQMLFTSAPLLIDATSTRAFLETAQRAAGQLAGALREAQVENVAHTQERIDVAVDGVRSAAAPLVATLDREQLAAAFGSDEMGAMDASES